MAVSERVDHRAAGLRLMIVGLNYDPEPVGIGPYTAGMARALAARGAQVRVIAGQPYYPQWRRYDGYRGWRTTREGGVEVTRVPLYVPALPSGVRRILHLVSFALAALFPALRAALSFRPQVVMVVAPSLLSIPIAWLAAKLAGARLWVHVQDFEVDAAFATGLLGGSEIGGLARLGLWLEGRLLALGDRVSTIAPRMAQRLAEKGVERRRIVEVRNWAAGFAPDPAGAARYRAEWGLENRRVALYAGNIANKQGLEVVVAAAWNVAHRDDIVFVICGEGPNRAALIELAAGLPNLRFHGLQPAERMGGLLALADVHLLPQVAGAADLMLPSKLINMLASGRPVIATAAPGSGLAAEVEGCGLVTQPGDAAALADAVEDLLGDPARCRALGAAALARANERWSQARVIDRLEGALAALVSEQAVAGPSLSGAEGHA